MKYWMSSISMKRGPRFEQKMPSMINSLTEMNCSIRSVISETQSNCWGEVVT